MISELAIRTAAITLGLFLAVAFYESLSTRDVLLAQTAGLARRHTRRRSVLAAAHGLTVLALIPILVVLWAVVLEAKAIPLALAFTLLLGGLPRIEDNLQLLADHTYESDLTLTMLAFLGALEAGLRLLTDLGRASRAVTGKLLAAHRRATKRPTIPDARTAHGHDVDPERGRSAPELAT